MDLPFGEDGRLLGRAGIAAKKSSISLHRIRSSAAESVLTSDWGNKYLWLTLMWQPNIQLEIKCESLES